MTKKNAFKKFSILSLVLMGLSALYTLLLVNFHWDISILAVVLSALYFGAVFYIFGIKILKNTNGKFILSASRLVEFMPYIFFISFILRRAGNTGTPFWYDVVTVILWFSIFILSIIVSRKLGYKHNKDIVADWAVMPVEKKYKGVARVIFEIGDWCYAIIWAIFSVLILQIFVIQLYMIPSESMVPTFLIKDRVFVSKIDCGPRFPLTDVGLPTFRKFKHGDTVVLRNPHYSMDRKSEVQTVTSQLVYMLTFMSVNMNKDENGEMKYDPLVKRIAGVPGEQLVMQDGVLYVRTAGSDDFMPSKTDAKYAVWNLNDLSSKYGNKINNYLFPDSYYDAIVSLEDERKKFDLDLASFEANNIVNEFVLIANKFNDDNPATEVFEKPSLYKNDLLGNLESLAYDMLSKKGGQKWFKDFITSWIPEKDKNRDMYSLANYKLNVMLKLNVGKVLLNYCKIYVGNENTLLSFEEQNDINQMLHFINFYLEVLDSRNMPVFPANDEMGNPQYLPEDCYFMMGDNRFNSLDLRHDTKPHKRALTEDDPMSIIYQSQINPQYVNKKLIIGKPIFTFWPLNRMGKV